MSDNNFNLRNRQELKTISEELGTLLPIGKYTREQVTASAEPLRYG